MLTSILNNVSLIQKPLRFVCLHWANNFFPLYLRPVLQKLLENKKIAAATHNIYAYRVFNSEANALIQDYDDDGETHAGSRLLHLLDVRK